MATTRESIDATIRARNPHIEVCDNGVCQHWTAGDAVYEAWVTTTVEDHAQAEATLAAEEVKQLDIAQRREQVTMFLAALESGKATPQQMQAALAHLLRRELGQ